MPHLTFVKDYFAPPGPDIQGFSSNPDFIYLDFRTDY